jgi:hypothetical protein
MFLACNEDENLAVCRRCIEGGIEKIEQRLRDDIATRRAAIPEQIEAAKRQIAELTAELQDESITLENSLVGRLQVPSYAEYARAKADAEMLEQLAYLADDVPLAEIPTTADLAKIDALYVNESFHPKK